MALTHFTVTGNFLSLAGTEAWEPPVPTLRPVSGTITFTPLFQQGEAVRGDDAVIVLQPVRAVISGGIVTRNGASGCKLIANTADLNLENLYYRVSFSDLRAADGQSLTLKSYDFQAPTTSVEVDLAGLQPVPGIPATGPPGSTTGPRGPQGIQGPQGTAGIALDINGTLASYSAIIAVPNPQAGDAYVSAADGTLYFYDGESWPDEGDGVPFQGPIGPQGIQGPIGETGPIGPTGATGPQGPAGIIAITATNTGNPGTNASVTNTGTASAAVLAFTIPRGDVGATGPTGPVGPVGPQGPQGAQGIQGEAGVSLDINGTLATHADLPVNPNPGDAYVVAADGLLYFYDGNSWPASGDGVPFQGPQGPQGAQGIQGEKGDKGDTGDVGPAGPIGPTGPTGATGPMGPTGPQGGSGGTGLPGQAANILGPSIYAALPPAANDGDAYVLPDGKLYIYRAGVGWPADGNGVQFVGPTGLTGPPGATGPTGPAGPIGPTGATGGTGGLGPAGPAGPEGPVGATGGTGGPGPAGAQGLQGPQGIQGEKGDTGDVGPAGPAGPEGPEGPVGATGGTGGPGPLGPIGPTGATGPVGPQGPEGPVGATGPVGPAGTTTWAGITDLPAVIASGATKSEARSAIDAEDSTQKGQPNGYASLDGGGKVPVSQLPSSIMQYQGTYNPVTHTPELEDGTGNTGDVYRVSVAGSKNFGSGAVTFGVGDYVIYNGTVWEKSDTTDSVPSVAGLTGDITASGLRSALSLDQVNNTADEAKAVLSATRLTTARTINGVAFDGSANISVPPTSAGQVADLSIIAFGSNTTRATGTGDFPFGIKLQRAITFSSVTYRAATADASGNLVVELRRNGTTVTGSSATIAAANQIAGGTATGSWAFAQGDIITVHVTAVGTTPGRGLIADVQGLTA